MGGSTFSVGGSTQSVTMRGNYADVRCRGFMFFFEVKSSRDQKTDKLIVPRFL